MSASLEKMIEDNKADMGKDPFAGRLRISGITQELRRRHYNLEFLEDMATFVTATALDAKALLPGNEKLPKKPEELTDFLNRFKTALNDAAKTCFAVDIDKPVVLKKIHTQDGQSLTAQHSPEDHAIFANPFKIHSMSAEQALSWIVHETGHEIILALRQSDPSYLYGEEKGDLEYFENYVSRCPDNEYHFGAYYEAYDSEVEETTVRYAQALFAHHICPSHQKAEKISNGVITNAESETGRYFRENHTILKPEPGLKKWFAKQFIHA